MLLFGNDHNITMPSEHVLQKIPERDSAGVYSKVENRDMTDIQQSRSSAERGNISRELNPRTSTGLVLVSGTGVKGTKTQTRIQNQTAEVTNGSDNPGFDGNGDVFHVTADIVPVTVDVLPVTGDSGVTWTDGKKLGGTENPNFDSSSVVLQNSIPETEGGSSEKKKAEKDNSGSRITLAQWMVLASGCYNGFVVLGLPFSLNVLYVELISYYNASRTEVVFVQSICVGLLYGGGILVGVISKLIGIRTTLFVGSILASAGLFASWFATSPYYVIISVGVVTGFGSCMGFVPLLAVVASNFQTRSSLAIATIMTSGGVGSLVLPKLFAYLVEIFSWKGAMLIMCAFYLNCTVCSLIVTSPVISSIPAINKDVDSAQERKSSSWRVLLNPLYCTYILTSMIAFGSMNGVTFTLVDFGKSKGLTQDNGINLLLALNGSNTVTRFLTGLFKMIPRLHTFHIFIIAVVTAATSVITLSYVGGFPVLLVLCVLFGFGLGILISIFPVGVYELSGEKMYPLALGIGTTANGMANILSGTTVGILYELTGSYQLPYRIFCGTALSAACLLLLVYIVAARKSSQTFHLPQLREEKDPIGWQRFMYL
ncbi:monocarboxylate transporter 6-like [Gigantopelta aegis]|uniref:monocarboxylate transporter 6-like n=1 Tax=Gigantopelta aegis TaxID=1735272 RepID=UPI001B88BCA3|nr:monocarboxylate transporter 6-like [Gigantopelta aegis]